MRKARALGAYIFAGGFTLGVEKHFDVIAHLEEGPYGVATARKNFPELPIFVGPENWPDDPAYKGIDLLYGNPPCAAWSQANGKSIDNWRTDPRVDCTRRHFGLLEQHHPKVWIWESVAATFQKGREFIDQLVLAAFAEGYAVTLYLHDAKYLGLPQNRARFMFIAHRIKLSVPTPDWTTIACGKALQGLNDLGRPTQTSSKLTERYGHLFPASVPGEDLRTTWNREVGKGRAEEDLPRNAQGHVAGRPNFLMKRSHPDRPANTVMHDQIHPIENRFLTEGELGFLCGYPSTFEVADYHEYTRAVMPPVGEHVAAIVRAGLEANEPIGTPSAVVVDHRKPPGDVYPYEPTIVVEGLSEVADPVPASSRTSARPAPRHREATTVEDRERQPRRAEPPSTEPLPVRPVPRPKDGVGRMKFLQVLIMMDRWTTAQLVEIIKHQWPTSKATGADVSTQRRVLAKAGYSVPPTRRHAAEALPWA